MPERTRPSGFARRVKTTWSLLTFIRRTGFRTSLRSQFPSLRYSLRMAETSPPLSRSAHAAVFSKNTAGIYGCPLRRHSQPSGLSFALPPTPGIGPRTPLSIGLQFAALPSCAGRNIVGEPYRHADDRLVRLTVLDSPNRHNFYCPFQLSARCKNIAATRTTNEGRNPGRNKNLLECQHPFGLGHLVGQLVPGFMAIRLIFARMPRTNSTSSRACSRESLTPASRTYSNVNRSRGRIGNSRAAFINSARFHFRLSGITSLRTASLDAFSEIASFGRTGSSPKSLILGIIPAVDTVIRDSGIPIPSTSKLTDFMKLS